VAISLGVCKNRNTFIDIPFQGYTVSYKGLPCLPTVKTHTTHQFTRRHVSSQTARNSEIGFENFQNFMFIFSYETKSFKYDGKRFSPCDLRSNDVAGRVT